MFPYKRSRLFTTLAEEMGARRKSDLYRHRQIINPATSPYIQVGNSQLLNFSSNDYLGLAQNEAIKDHMIAAVRKYGMGAVSSPLLVGYTQAHELLENKLAQFLNRDTALLFPSGYQANLSLASVFADSDTVILQDKYNHASLIDSALLSKGKLLRYRHRDLEHLVALLEKHKSRKLLVMTDGVFSMDGDVAPLLEIADICQTYNALLVVDDAHGLGVMGDRGAGLLEKLKLGQEHVPILVGTFGKAFAASGAFIAGDSTLLEAFVQKARPYIYSTALLPSLASTLAYTVDVIAEATALREKLTVLIRHYKTKVNAAGLGANGSDTHIQPFILGDPKRTCALKDDLYKKEIMLAAIRPPTVPKDSSRLRISLTAAHTHDHVTYLVNALKEALGDG